MLPLKKKKILMLEYGQISGFPLNLKSYHKMSLELYFVILAPPQPLKLACKISSSVGLDNENQGQISRLAHKFWVL